MPKVPLNYTVTVARFCLCHCAVRRCLIWRRNRRFRRQWLQWWVTRAQASRVCSTPCWNTAAFCRRLACGRARRSSSASRATRLRTTTRPTWSSFRVRTEAFGPPPRKSRNLKLQFSRAAKLWNRAWKVVENKSNDCGLFWSVFWPFLHYHCFLSGCFIWVTGLASARLAEYSVNFQLLVDTFRNHDNQLDNLYEKLTWSISTRLIHSALRLTVT